ncbi:hypothetical protein ABFP37_18730 [Burkholderia sp. RS01]
MPRSTSTPSPLRYTDFYGMLSYKDFLAAEAAGTLANYAISARTDQEEAA